MLPQVLRSHDFSRLDYHRTMYEQNELIILEFTFKFLKKILQTFFLFKDHFCDTSRNCCWSSSSYFCQDSSKRACWNCVRNSCWDSPSNFCWSFPRSFWWNASGNPFTNHFCVYSKSFSKDSPGNSRVEFFQDFI